MISIHPRQDGSYLVDLSSVQQSSVGQLLEWIFYSKNSLLDLVAHSGYPHNGSEHTLNITGTKETICSWIDLVIETVRALPKEQQRRIARMSYLDTAISTLLEVRRRVTDGSTGMVLNERPAMNMIYDVLGQARDGLDQMLALALSATKEFVIELRPSDPKYNLSDDLPLSSISSMMTCLVIYPCMTVGGFRLGCARVNSLGQRSAAEYFAISDGHGLVSDTGRTLFQAITDIVHDYFKPTTFSEKYKELLAKELLGARRSPEYSFVLRH